MAHTVTYREITAPRWGEEELEWQKVEPKFRYVHGTNKNSALIHTVKAVRLRWWTYSEGGHYLVRLATPRMIAESHCGRSFFIDTTKAKMCNLPKENAVLCKSCVGGGRNFPRGKEHEVPLPVAKVRLGCVEQAL